MADAITCPACGQVLRQGTNPCTSCGAATDGAAGTWTDAGVAPMEAAAPPPPPPPPQPAWTSEAPTMKVGWAVTAAQPPNTKAIGHLVRPLQLALGGWIVIAIAGFLARLKERSLLQSLRDDPLFLDFDQLVASDDRLAAVGGFSILATIGIAVLFIVWSYRAYTNLTELGATSLRHTKGLAIGGWIVPIASLFIPYQVMASIWRGSEAQRQEFNLEWWKRGTTSPIIKLWWATFLIGMGMGQLGGIQMGGDPMTTTIDDLLGANQLILLAVVVQIASAVLAILVVQKTTERQRERATLLGATI